MLAGMLPHRLAPPVPPQAFNRAPSQPSRLLPYVTTDGWWGLCASAEIVSHVSSEMVLRKTFDCARVIPIGAGWEWVLVPFFEFWGKACVCVCVCEGVQVVLPGCREPLHACPRRS
jgi:hypothetical protein